MDLIDSVRGALQTQEPITERAFTPRKASAQEHSPQKRAVTAVAEVNRILGTLPKEAIIPLPALGASDAFRMPDPKVLLHACKELMPHIRTLHEAVQNEQPFVHDGMLRSLANALSVRQYAIGLVSGDLYTELTASARESVPGLPHNEFPSTLNRQGTEHSVRLRSDRFLNLVGAPLLFLTPWGERIMQLHETQASAFSLESLQRPMHMNAEQIADFEINLSRNITELKQRSAGQDYPALEIDAQTLGLIKGKTGWEPSARKLIAGMIEDRTGIQGNFSKAPAGVTYDPKVSVSDLIQEANKLQAMGAFDVDMARLIDELNKSNQALSRSEISEKVQRATALLRITPEELRAITSLEGHIGNLEHQKTHFTGTFTDVGVLRAKIEFLALYSDQLSREPAHLNYVKDVAPLYLEAAKPTQITSLVGYDRNTTYKRDESRANTGIEHHRSTVLQLAAHIDYQHAFTQLATARDNPLKLPEPITIVGDFNMRFNPPENLRILFTQFAYPNSNHHDHDVLNAQIEIREGSIQPSRFREGGKFLAQNGTTIDISETTREIAKLEATLATPVSVPPSNPAPQKGAGHGGWFARLISGSNSPSTVAPEVAAKGTAPTERVQATQRLEELKEYRMEWTSACPSSERSAQPSPFEYQDRSGRAVSLAEKVLEKLRQHAPEAYAAFEGPSTVRMSLSELNMLAFRSLPVQPGLNAGDVLYAFLGRNGLPKPKTS